MSFCVNIKSKEFIDASQRLDIHPSQLESIVHEYINQEGVSADSFPSDDYILSKTKGKEGAVVSEAQYKLWERDFSKPTSIYIATPLNEELNYIYQFFPKEMVGKQMMEGQLLLLLSLLLNLKLRSLPRM